MANDVVVDTNGLIALIISGSTPLGVTGLQARLNSAFPAKGIEVMPAIPEFLLSGETNFPAELDHPYVTIVDQVTTPRRVFWKDVVPKATPAKVGWSRKHLLRLDVWGRTPPEAKEVADAVEVAVKRLQNQLWHAARIGVDAQGITDAITGEGWPVLYHKYLTVEASTFVVQTS